MAGPWLFSLMRLNWRGFFKGDKLKMHLWLLMGSRRLKNQHNKIYKIDLHPKK
jgi:hypothetical protein